MANNTLSFLRDHWSIELAPLYPESEIRFIFRIAVEDLLGLSYHRQLSPETMLDTVQTEVLGQALQRLKTGEPVQHITGFTYFDDLKIRVSPAVLIPRPETEELVHWISEDAEPDSTVLDICTGSGCIALALKKRFPASTVTGIDISSEAIRIARSNAQVNQLEVVFKTGDALQPGFEARPGIIVSNPPYIPVKEKTGMHVNVKNFEPSLALFVPDADPLLFYRAITQYAAENLEKGGKLFFELHEKYAEETKELVQSCAAFHSAEIRQDLQGKSRMLRAVKR